MSGYLLGWGSLLLRWLHLITGTAWIGSSFYFVWLDNPLLAPERPETTAHWFSWQAYSTWLSGVGLLGLLYFLHADAYLIDPAVRMLTPGVAVLIAVGILVGSWLAYEGLCRSRLRHSTVRLVIALALLACLVAWGVCALFSGRAAFILFGAAIGTVMVGNVLLRGRLRSIHNTYLTLPVLFVMISNHYAMTYSVHYNWLALIAMCFSGVCIRVWFVARHKPAGRIGFESLLPLIMGLLALVIVIIGLYPDCALPVCPQPPQG